MIQPLQIRAGLPFALLIQWTRDDLVVDTTGWEGALTIRKRPTGDLIGEYPVDVQTPGEIFIELTAVQTADLPQMPQLGFFETADFQIDLSGLGDFVRLQGRVAVGAEL
jgi:hypothetical protein